MNQLSISCTFSKCRDYRYVFSVKWKEGLPSVLFIGLNPSVADEYKLDPSALKMVRLARDWGFGQMNIINLFAYITPYPKALFQSKSPIGPDNDAWIEKLIGKHESIVAVWGNHGKYKNRHRTVLEKIESPLCLKRNKTGMPAHPLYLKNSVLPFPYIIE